MTNFGPRGVGLCLHDQLQGNGTSVHRDRLWAGGGAVFTVTHHWLSQNMALCLIMAYKGGGFGVHNRQILAADKERWSWPAETLSLYRRHLIWCHLYVKNIVKFHSTFPECRKFIFMNTCIQQVRLSVCKYYRNFFVVMQTIHRRCLNITKVAINLNKELRGKNFWESPSLHKTIL